MGAFIDLTGKKFNRLHVIKRINNINWKKPRWLCKCDCGIEKIIPSLHLKNGNTKSCGCLRKERHKQHLNEQHYNNQLPFGESSFNQLYYQYKHSAEIKNREFNLSKEQFKKLTSSDCFYCGCEPITKKCLRESTGYYMYNGVDRVDSNEGYKIDNCVPCCYICNRMKMDHTKEFFIEHIKKIFHNQLI